ncbi:MAG: hypothetical protein HQ523_07130 [Lentisphaerae bacterium]|nr:hypothetical protein [Lentisphaerota bacterium]
MTRHIHTATQENHREAIELALAGGTPERVPFSYYDLLFPPDFDPASLQAKGMAICARRDVCRKRLPNVKVTEITERDGSLRTSYETPVGTLTSLFHQALVGMAPAEYLIKRREDYRAAQFIVEDTVYDPMYDAFREEERKIGVTGKVIGHTGYDPMLDLQIMWIGQEQFCYELADNEDALMELYEAMVRRDSRMFDVVAKGPADVVLYSGNLVPEMVGPDLVRRYICPVWDAFADVLHEHGKKLGVHLDANNRLILDMVRDLRIDLVEAFTPPPDCNVTVAEARAAWPGKVLWINFPSSVHLQSEEVLRSATLEILNQAGDRSAFLMGVTEDVPRVHMDRSPAIILDVLKEQMRS